MYFTNFTFSQLSDDAEQIIQCLRFGKKSNQYSEELRSFAFTLNFYSPRAYQFVREKFSNHLPAPSCIRSWVANATGFGEPGINTEALQVLESIAKDMNAQGKQLVVSMCFDEMHIHKHVEWNDARKKFHGFISFGKTNAEGEVPVANQALVFLVTGINFKMSIPVAHFFVTKLNGSEKAILIQEIVTAITKVGVRIINITFDGDPANLAACKRLGASFFPKNMKTYFLNPVDQSKVFVTLDPCHMLKLIRNSLGNEKVFKDGNNENVNWHYFERLENYRLQRSMVTHKLTKRHIQWNRSKMTVKFAAQLFSKSVGDSLNYLRSQICEGFENCGATINMTYIINDLFDIFNSNNKSTNPTNQIRAKFKNPLTRSSAHDVFSFLDRASEYLKSLRIGKKKILQHKKRFGFKGFLINIESLKGMYHEYVESGLLDELPTYLLSQDPLEATFGRVRSLNGNNDNPNQLQFTSAFRKILINNEITASKHANCVDKLNIFKVSSRRQDSTKRRNENTFKNHIASFTSPHESDIELGPVTLNENDLLMNCCEEITIATIASSIQTKINNFGRFDCDCKFVFDRNKKTTELAISKDRPEPCLSTVHICKVANICFNQCKSQIDFDYDALVERTIEAISLKDIFTDFFVCDVSHKKGFVKYLVEEFIRLQATYIAKNLTLVEEKIMCRKQLKRTVHLLGQ